MNKKRKSPILLVVVLLFIAVAGVIIVFATYHGVGGRTAVVRFQDYEITVEGNVYSSGTRTGTIDLAIKNNGSPF